jgi:hypothetical protein
MLRLTDSVSERERQLNELKGALDLLFELREEFAQWVEEAQDGSKRRRCFRLYRSYGKRIPDSTGRTQEIKVRLVALAAGTPPRETESPTSRSSRCVHTQRGGTALGSVSAARVQDCKAATTVRFRPVANRLLKTGDCRKKKKGPHVQ